MNDNSWLFPVIIISALLFFVTAVVVFDGYLLAKYEAKVLNEKFGTSYTTADLFWAGDSIEQIIEGEYRRVDVNLTGIER